jgi:hypothetical protein
LHNLLRQLCQIGYFAHGIVVSGDLCSRQLLRAKGMEQDVCSQNQLWIGAGRPCDALR